MRCPFVLVIASSDKQSTAMFSDFIKTIYLRDVPYEELDYTNLYSEKVQDELFQNVAWIKNQGRCVIVRYKVSYRTDLKTYKFLSKITEVADYIVGFDMYALNPMVLKEVDSMTDIIDRWNRNILKMNGGRPV